VEVEDALALEVTERALHDRRELHRVRPRAVCSLEGADVLLGRFHAAYAPSE
jgi:hypothetical protein